MRESFVETIGPEFQSSAVLRSKERDANQYPSLLPKISSNH